MFLVGVSKIKFRSLSNPYSIIKSLEPVSPFLTHVRLTDIPALYGLRQDRNMTKTLHNFALYDQLFYTKADKAVFAIIDGKLIISEARGYCQMVHRS